ncbi:DUF4352 domain-containing protein [Nocardia shimofusensis]|uniref:DUF4352 domain-containing protein n=1 Tax=Nocardia shimofusensis TaxID=228596 RepID=UPI001FDEBC52|nr:DUF4352 domain-containing protein [Nocardia shimofusensis]
MAVVVLAVCGGCIALLGGIGTEIAEDEEARTSAQPAGSEVRDGKFSFVVTRVDPPVTEVGDNEIMRETAQGEFVLVHVEVTNTANEPQTYFSENQKLIDDQGREYTNDSMAEMSVNAPNMITEINPGNKLSTIIVYDVPRGTVPAAIEFHDSTFSGGARVALK